MKLVRDRLFIGNITDANSVIQSVHPKVTHMLSLLSSQVLYQQNPKPGDPYSLVTMRAGAHCLPTTADSKNSNVESPGNGTKDDSQTQDAEVREFVRMTVPLRDMESENLLDHLEACLAFIKDGRKTGDVLVHCLAGVSRREVIVASVFSTVASLSVAVNRMVDESFEADIRASVITAYLMQTEKLSVDDALASLRQASSSACPNEGFMDQVILQVNGLQRTRELKMFEEMGFKVDHESSIYKQFHVANLGKAYLKGENIESSRFASDPGANNMALTESIGSHLKLDEENRVPTLYRCKKCRRLVACESNVITHSSGMGEPSFRAKRRGGGCGHDDDYGEPKCSSIFVEPMQYMSTVIEGHVEGKLFCITCQARLGNFHWAGLQCSCGAWVNPAFQLHKSRMDLTWI